MSWILLGFGVFGALLLLNSVAHTTGVADKMLDSYAGLLEAARNRSTDDDASV